VIHDVVLTALDLTFTDPAADRFIGYALDYTLDFSTYVSLVTKTANADTPLIWDDSEGTTPDFALGVPVFLFDFVGNGSTTGYSNGNKTNQFGGNNSQTPVRVPANALVRLRMAGYVAGVLADMTGLDNMNAAVIGKFV
jgi:hypothetical protein